MKKVNCEVEKRIYNVVNNDVEVYILKEFNKVANKDIYEVHIRLAGYGPLMDCYGTFEESFDDAFDLIEANLIEYFADYVKEYAD